MSFLDNASDVDILHLSMHAKLDSVNPENSAFILADDQVQLQEIYGLELNAQLAVLSACNTGIGKYKRGIGDESLSRALSCAGVSSTVMSLWSVPDESTSKIMMSFYDNLVSGMTKDLALYNSKMDYLKNCEHQSLRAPYYWAGFIVMGDASEIDLSGNFSEKSIWTVAVLAVLVILYLLFRRKKN